MTKVVQLLSFSKKNFKKTQKYCPFIFPTKEKDGASKYLLQLVK
jgi:hypothetical protein